MKTIIAGGREITDLALVEQAVADSGFEITTVISGKARGVDTLGEQWARRHGIPVIAKPADWKRYGKARAGFIRNAEMAKEGDALILVWWGNQTHSPGSANMKMEAVMRGLKVYEKLVPMPGSDDDGED